jgi:TonB-dependent receptor
MKISFKDLHFSYGKVILLFTMRIFIILFYTTLFAFSPEIAFSQNTVSVDEDKIITVDEVFELVRRQTDYMFVYQNDMFANTPKVLLKKGNISVRKLLKQSLGKGVFEYEITESKTIYISSLPQQSGKIEGVVVDEYGQPLPGATIQVVGTDKATIADENGAYLFSLLPGNYTVEISYISYHTQRVTDVVVTSGQETILNIVLKEDVKSLNEVVITQTYARATATTEGMLLEQKRAAQMSDGISAEQIARTPDNDVGSTLKRITGITTLDERYVVVRSMGERWNQAVLDGISLPSTDAYQQNFSFDIIPTAMVESVVVSKTATPDMYANFAGGYVEVRTKSIPKENFTLISVGSSFNSRSTFKERLTKQQGSLDYLGFDDGSRDFPSGLQNIPVPNSEAESGPFLEQSRRFTNDNFTTYKTDTPLNSSYIFALGRSYDLKDNNRWGFTGSLQLRNTQNTLEIDHTERGSFLRNTNFVLPEEEGGYYSLQQYGYKNSGASYTYNTVMSGMFNAGLQLGKHRFNIRNSYIHVYNNELTSITGWDYYADEQEQVANGISLPRTLETSYPIYQDILQSKLEGNHKLGDFEVNWYAAYSSVGKDIKDATFLQTSRRKVGDDILLYNEAYNSAFRFPFGRTNILYDEKDVNVAANINYNLNLGNFNNHIKTGYFGNFKNAVNQQETVNLRVVGQSEDQAQFTIPVSELLNGSYYNYGGFGWEKRGYSGKRYEGKVAVHSPFIMLDNKYKDAFRLVWGVRAEYFEYTQVSSQLENAGDFDPSQRDDKKWQLLPSVNFTYSPTKNTNLRLGYNRSVLRPQFAERLSIPFYDPVRTALITTWSGGLVSSVSDNYDAKIEWFPSLGQIVSFGVYSKNIANPIEGITAIGNEGARTIYNLNSVSVKLRGIEAEVIKNLTFLGPGEILENLFIYGNGAINKTEVTSYVNIDGTGGLYKANRPLYGQSPYTYNFGLDYKGERLGFSIRQNGSGDQYILVGYNYEAEEIRMPYAVTDAQVSFKFLKDHNLELKCSIQNLFDRPIETYNNYNSYSDVNEDFETGTDNPRDRYNLIPGSTRHYDEGIDRKLYKAWTGTTIRLNLAYSF